jgi:hypothetical protein
MQTDTEQANSSNRRQKEFYRIFNSLNKTQVAVAVTNKIKCQRKVLEEAILKLSMENIKLAQIEYEEKAASILLNIKAILKMNLKFIPSSIKVIRYVKPKMMTRRFFQDIFPKLRAHICDLIDSLRHEYLQMHPVNANTAKENKSTIILNANANMGVVHNNLVDLDCSNENPIVIQDSVAPNNTMETELPFTVVENRKRKNLSLARKISCSSEEELSRVQEKRGKPTATTGCTSPVSCTIETTETPMTTESYTQGTSRPPTASLIPRFKFKTPQKGTNVVKTSTEAFTIYKSYAPKEQSLPNLANPPDSTRRAVLASAVSTKSREQISNICNDANTTSTPNYSLLTLHSTDHENLPKSHISLKISAAVLSNNNALNLIPSGLNFIYEIL